MSILGDRIVNARVLDLFAGSGGLGLEAISRGASHATLVEISALSLGAIRQNVDALAVSSRVTVHRGDAMRFIEQADSDRFDIALADPPYTIPFAEQLVDAFRIRPFAKLFAVEHPVSMALGGDMTRRYGDIALTFCYSP